MADFGTRARSTKTASALFTVVFTLDIQLQWLEGRLENLAVAISHLPPDFIHLLVMLKLHSDVESFLRKPSPKN
jgi:hypothetical protein